MIVPMRKTYVVSRGADRERVLAALGELGVLHLAPIDPARAVAGDQTLAKIDRLGRVGQVLRGVEPAGDRPDLEVEQAAEEVLSIQRRAAERRARLATIHQQVRQLEVWGDVTLEQLRQLREAGVEVTFYSVANAAVAAVRAEFAQPVTELPGRRTVVAVIDRDGTAELPEGAEPLELPARDRPSLRAEAAEIDASLAADEKRLAGLAHLADRVAAEHARCREEARFAVALQSGMEQADLYAVQGWVPADEADRLAGRLAEAGLDAGVQTIEPAEDETPPTLIRYPAWVRPIKGLFDILQTAPGYREFDLSGAFMLALPVFAAMLIGDGGYGLLFFLVPALLYKKACAKLGKPLTQLVMVIGFTSLVWGVAISSFFGVDSQHMVAAGGLFAQLGVLLERLHVLTVSISDADAQRRVMRLCFLIGAVHLSAAHLWRALAYFPNLRFLCEAGWAVFLWGMMFVVNALVISDPFPQWAYALLAAGAALAVLFANVSRNPLKWLGIGIASFPLAAISTLSDIISYVRLFAVGVASGVLAVSFNDMAAGAGSPFIAVPILVLGHSLNIILGAIALFAHGVRLNMLEFSNNIGMEWSGYAYNPFAKTLAEEK